MLTHIVLKKNGAGAFSVDPGGLLGGQSNSPIRESVFFVTIKSGFQFICSAFRNNAMQKDFFWYNNH